MEELKQQIIQKQQTNIFAVHIEGDKSGFVSKSAIDKFKNIIKTKSNENFNLEELINKYVKLDFTLIQTFKSENEIKFTICEKHKHPQTIQDLSDAKQKLRNKLKEKQQFRTNQEPYETKYTTGQVKSSELIKNVIEKIQEKRPSHRIIDISNMLNINSYVEYQKANYFTNIVMVVERNSANESVFDPRSNSEKSNVMVMYQGSYRTFNYELMNLVIDSVVEIIKI